MKKDSIQIAYFGAGCFWGVEYVFKRVPGVLKTEVGYMGGDLKNPSYEEVCEGDTGHAEVLSIEFDSSKIKYSKLLEVFFKCHDPTTIDRQGPDIGNQYRSCIFYLNDNQKIEAENYLKKYEEEIGKKIVTEIVPASNFYSAEKYHQNYYDRKGAKPYCHIVPKINF